MKIDLTGKTALVTGGSGQLGRVMCLTLAQCGADVVVHFHRNAQEAERVVQAIRALGRRSMAVQADVTVKAEVDAMKTLIEAEMGPVDIMVNNAVIQYRWTRVLEQPLEDYDSQYRSCILHNVLMAQAFVPGMVERGHGRVIGINTECAMQNDPGQGAYVAGKRGMDGVLRVLAKEVGEHQITVNQVAPGWTISEDHPESEASLGYREKVPMKRRGTDQDIANLVAFLASDLAGFITGQYISVSGGNVMPTI
ncbi:SDR family NAD(P)-dependent oxidoreductase [Deinococcus cellulosilyticus]|uniref:Beta-ketoacyl-ACP reductase n=1 Tax=Deinococcus cellulosilyticus (strain DSM 18568 / NBRC 106333 / KACC 11606 / 5516J-15) TaxID=1223518 RepID=A0A511N1U5_DEIC1|nr:SDR family oxidoreductase [Deinococcus cellulosilyticus]GEM46825.1 beta-ketoacyl-ACP reductase [Deinococcus cellulosilyticus NBRC 106333 = KACC 11606]